MCGARAVLGPRVFTEMSGRRAGERVAVISDYPDTFRRPPDCEREDCPERFGVI